jgi:hypothetical protein
MKKKLLIISPHFSSGGAPQVSVNKVELLKNDFEIKVVEYSFLAYQFVVQRNRMINLVGLDNFHSLSGDKSGMLKKIIEDYSPDIISMEEFPEMFMDKAIADWIYFSDRKYKIFETTHDSSFNPKNKIYTPDEFVFVSAFNSLMFNQFNVPTSVVQYPVDYTERNKVKAREELGLEHDYKHIVVIGLFTPRKNQKYSFELAEKLSDYKLKFHFIGNQAENFAFYWKPLMDKKPENCIVWGERSDTETFLQAADLFLFTSKGDKGNKELNPLVILEAAKYQDLPKLMYNLDVYLNKYNQKTDFNLLSGDTLQDVDKIKALTSPSNLYGSNEELIVLGTYPNLKSRVQLTKDTIKSLKVTGRDVLLISHLPADTETQNLVEHYIYDKYNPLTHHSYYTRFFRNTDDYYAEININGLKYSNQSLCVYINLITAAKYAKQMGYKRFFYTTYDVILHEKDLDIIEESYKSVQSSKGAFLGTLDTPFGKGIQTNGMTFDVDYFLQAFEDVRTPDKYNELCERVGAQNFLEDFLIKVITNNNSNNEVTLIHNQEQTLLKNSGLGVASNSEYYSILPIVRKQNNFMFYFYTYNVDDRKLKISIDSKNFNYMKTIEISKTNEAMQEFVYSGEEVLVTLEFYDGEQVYKKEHYKINEDTLPKYSNTGHFKWNKRPKIKLVHLQTTRNDEKEQKSREQLQKVREYGWEYILHTNTPYTDLPPKHNCQRPDCVSYELFDEPTIQRIGTALTPSHYGCYLAFKEAILTEFEDCDYLMVCEGDCKIEMPIEDFIKTVESTCPTITDNNVGYMSYGDKATLEHGWLQSPVVREIPNQDLIYITNHIIGLQCIMFPINIKKWLKEKLRTHSWDASDMFYNSVFVNSPYNMAILHKRITSQFDGFSTIDRTNKTFL